MGEYDSGEFNSGKKGECNSPRQFNPPRQQKLSSVWQRNYWEHIIRDQRAFENISNYIIHNPLNWKEDRFSG